MSEGLINGETATLLEEQLAKVFTGLAKNGYMPAAVVLAGSQERMLASVKVAKVLLVWCVGPQLLRHALDPRGGCGF
jgi:hypothetical protein